MEASEEGEGWLCMSRVPDGYTKSVTTSGASERSGDVVEQGGAGPSICVWWRSRFEGTDDSMVTAVAQDAVHDGGVGDDGHQAHCATASGANQGFDFQDVTEKARERRLYEPS